MAMNNGEIVYDAFCQSGILGGSIPSISQAKEIADYLNQYYVNYNLHLKAINIFGKTSKKVEVMVDKQLAENYTK